jgi:hypothetical protein
MSVLEWIDVATREGCVSGECEAYPKAGRVVDVMCTRTLASH